MAEPAEILAAIENILDRERPLAGCRALVTSGPTWEAIDPVRYIANRSSGKQGHSIAAALAEAGAATALVTGPTRLADPGAVRTIHVESAREMLDACVSTLPVDIAICVAAVSDWRTALEAGHKLKKNPGATPPLLALTENPDILAHLSKSDEARPRLVIGFAAETEAVVEQAKVKRLRKGCDWILANDVSSGTGTFGGDENTVHLVTASSTESWPKQGKDVVAARLVARIATHFAA